jgi:hypothetical protein
MKLLLTFFILIISLKTHACICPSTSIKETREYSIRNSELIFIGQVIETDTINHTYKIKVVEIFKGNPAEILIGSSLEDSVSYSSCAFWPFPYWGDEFIFYANYAKGTNRIFVDQCSATRTTLNPQAHLSYFIGKYEKMQGILYKEMTFEDKIKSLKTYNKLKQIAFKDLIAELKYLRRLANGR